MVQPSPYTPGAIARQVPGRDQELADYQERLSFMAATQSLVPRIRIDRGPRGLGKTSMLRAAETMAEQQFNALSVWVVAGEGSLLSAIARSAERAVADVTGDRSSERGRLSERLTVKFGLSVPGVGSAEATVAPRAREPEGEGPVDTWDLQDLLTEVRDKVRKQRPGGVVVFIDEIQQGDPESLRTLSYTWQNLQARRPDLPVALFGAGLPTSTAVINRAVTNAERFDYRTLGGLSDDAAAIALAAPAQQRGVQWTPEALRRAVAQAEGYPYTVQLIGEHTWAAAGRPDPGTIITAEHVERGQALVDRSMQQIYEARLDRATTPAQQEFVMSMAQLGDGPVPRAAIAQRLGVSSTGLSTTRDELLEAGVVTEAGRGMLTFGLPGFAEFIRDEHGLELTPPDPDRSIRGYVALGASFRRGDGRGRADGQERPGPRGIRPAPERDAGPER
ncbi:ATP-binding protein [Tsukamurella columbiensis]|uniref:ATP-binding protein n=1 Tax=Tsukamurella columbiensis TaxID=128509 RepID=UPI00223B20F6|nr:ATP-binding protein [Tsukamurella columbiensis]